MPGIRRKRAGTGFTYVGAGRPQDHRQEGRSPGSGALAIPPAYTDVWICPHPNGHIQATGRDARGAQAVSVPPEVARGPGRRPSSAGWSRSAEALPAIRERVSKRPGDAGSAPGEGARDGGAAARVHRDPGGQRRVRPGEPLVRAHHPAGPARRDLGLEAAIPVPGEERQDSRRGAHRPAAGADRRRAARRCRGRRCSSTWTTNGIRQTDRARAT